MQLKKATPNEFDSIFAMGYDAWHAGLSLNDYLASCRNSKKYQSGSWYVLTNQNGILSSLIVYRDQFGLPPGCFGIGSIATPPKLRGQGYASQLLQQIRAELFENHACHGIYLHSDINPDFYSQFGFTRLESSNCMVCFSRPFTQNFNQDTAIPAYF
jgi:predicted N-acetyltransferase YhbS